MSECTIVCNDKAMYCVSKNKSVVCFPVCEDDEDSNQEISSLKRFPNLQNIESLSCGARHCVCLDIHGKIFSFGDNEYGQLGITSIESTLIPQRVNLPSCKQVACGYFFTMCITEEDVLYSFGDNMYGQLGLGSQENMYASPQVISSLNNVKLIACGGDFVFCQTKDEVYSWGTNAKGQLGNMELSFLDPVLSPQECDDVPGDIIDIKCGHDHTLILTSRQQVWSCGYNHKGQLGHSSGELLSACFRIVYLTKIKITRIACGYFHSMCLDSDNNLYVFGDNKYGQLGLGDTKCRNKPMKHPSLSNIIDVSRGGNHSFVKTSNNEIYAFGNNRYSQLGITAEKDKQLTPIRIFEDNEDIWY